MSIEFNTMSGIKFRSSDNKILSLSAPSTLQGNVEIVLGRYMMSVEAIQDDVILANESSSIIPIDMNQQVITLELPVATVGLHYRFVVSTSGNFDCVILAQPADRLNGFVMAETTRIACSNATQITFNTNILGADDAVQGDTIDLFCVENNRWSVLAFAQNSAGITVP